MFDTNCVVAYLNKLASPTQVWRGSAPSSAAIQSSDEYCLMRTRHCYKQGILMGRSPVMTPPIISSAKTGVHHGKICQANAWGSKCDAH